jgi:hypothetical protein
MSDGGVKGCTNCSRAPQPLSQFLTKSGKPCKTCLKCREKGKKHDKQPDRKEYHENLKNEMKGEGYWVDYGKKKRNGEIPEKEHDMEQKCKWSRNEKALERLAHWKKLNVHDRIGNYRRSAISKNREWRLTDDEAGNMMTSSCIYCNHLDLTKRLNGIDRLDPDGHYTKENTVACCWTCNYMKGVMDPRTFIEKCQVIGRCDSEFPDIPRQELDLYRGRKPTAPQLPTLQSLPKTPPQ